MEHVLFKNWIRYEWGTCNDVRKKANYEGKSYFYDSYARVPCDWETYSDMINGTCYCDKCSNSDKCSDSEDCSDCSDSED